MRLLSCVALLVVLASATALGEEGEQSPSTAPAVTAPPAAVNPPAAATPPAAAPAPSTTPPMQLGTPDVPLIVKPILEPKPQAEIAAEEEDREERRSNDRSILVFDGIVAAFALILAVATIGIGFELRKLRRSVAQQAMDTAEQLRLTRQSVETAIALERPAFGVESTSIVPHGRGATIDLGNHGRTLAIVTQDCLVLKLADALPDDPRYPISEVEGISNSKSVDPGRDYEIYRSKGATDDEWERALQGNSVLWAYGYLEYIDFLKQRRRAGFCLAFVPTRQGPDATAGRRDGIWVLGGPASYTYDEPVVYSGPELAPSAASPSAAEREDFRKIEPATDRDGA